MLTFTTCQAENTFPAAEAIAGYLTMALGQPVSLVSDRPWQDRLAALLAGEISLGWVCGLVHARTAQDTLKRLAVPVNQGKRYAGQPVYYSDVVVRRDSPYETFEDLRGCVWGYNEPGSFSGAVSAFAHLAAMGHTAAFFSRLVETGAHAHSLRMLLAGQLDGAAIDSSVLAWSLTRDPGLAEKIRIVETVGPAAAPPIVASRGLAGPLRSDVRRAMLGMHESAAGRRALAAGALVKLVPGSDAAYERIRAADQAASRAGFLSNPL
jgi:phosphonate transport system substrate-binding protein